jgi:hypothetical protein
MAPRNRLDDLPDEILSKVYQMSEVLQLENLPAEILRKIYGFVLAMRRQVFDASATVFQKYNRGRVPRLALKNAKHIWSFQSRWRENVPLQGQGWFQGRQFQF